MDIGKVNMKNADSVGGDALRCLHTLYGTREGTQPLDRNFGLDATIVGRPIEVVKNLYALDVIEKTKKYEPRVKVREVTFEVVEDTLIPTIHIEKGE